MALIDDIYIKEEPKDETEDVKLSKSPAIPLKLEADNLLQDRPEYVSLPSAEYNVDDAEDKAWHGKEATPKKDMNQPSVSTNIHRVADYSCEQGKVEEDLSLQTTTKEPATESQEKTESEDSFSDDSDEGFVCKVCKQRFVDDFLLELHIKSRRVTEKCYKCCGCDKQFRDNTQLTVHARKHTGEQPYVCNICGKKFSVSGNLSKHMRIHTGERKYECDTCQRKFTQFAHLEDHLKIHSGDRPFVCDFCNSGFKTKARLKKHRKSHEAEKITKRSVPCQVCNKIMKSSKQLIAHMDTHHEEGSSNPFFCGICGKSYKHMFALNFHLKKHGGIRDFKCNLCDKTLSNASHLRRHLNSHSGVRPYSCELCMRAFPSRQNLNRHMMTHTGEKPYSCQECGKGFLSLENLTRHKRTHTGEKPFPCHVCGKFFAHSTTAKEHQRIHTGDKPFKCSICSKRFALNKALYKHVREWHPVYFPEFKRLNDLPPNVRRAREKMKRELEEVDVKNVTLVADVSVTTDVKSDLVKKYEDFDDEGRADEIPFIKVEKQELDDCC